MCVFFFAFLRFFLISTITVHQLGKDVYRKYHSGAHSRVATLIQPSFQIPGKAPRTAQGVDAGLCSTQSFPYKKNVCALLICAVLFCAIPASPCLVCLREKYVHFFFFFLYFSLSLTPGSIRKRQGLFCTCSKDDLFQQFQNGKKKRS